MEQSPADDATLGALGFAGICRETLRVISSRPPYFLSSCGLVITLSFSLLAHVAVVSRVLFSYAVTAASDANGTGSFVRPAANWALFLLGEAAFLLLINFLSFVSALLFVISVAPRYSAADAGRDARSVRRDLGALPRSHAKYFLSVYPGQARLFARLNRTDADARFDATARDAFLLLLGYTALFGVAALLTHPHRAAMLLVGGTAYLAGAAYIGVVWHVACVLSILEDGATASGFRAMHRSDELLIGAGKFWATAAVFTTLDGCAVAVQLAFGALVVDNRMGLGVWVRVAAWVAMAAVLCAAVVSGLVAQVVVYFVCKSFHRRRESSTTAKSVVDVVRRGRATQKNRKQQ